MEIHRSPLDVAISAELCRRSFYEFFLEFWETIEAVELIPNWHIKYICGQLQEVYETWERGESQPDVLINVPPGSSKSTIVVQLFPAWLWVKNPSIRIISSSYSGELSIAHAVKSRDCLKSDKFQLYFPGQVVFKSDSDGKSAYKNTAKGERYTTSTGGAVTGKHGDFLMPDDPINPKKAASEVERRTANEHVGATLSTRKTNKNRSVTIMVMQRLHAEDPAGVWLKKKKELRHICLPGELTKDVKPPELAARYTNGLLDTSRLDREALAKLKEDLGSYGYAGQVLQTPAPDGGGLFKRDWFSKIAYAEFMELTKGRTLQWEFDADTAYTKDKENDPSGFMASCYYNNILYIRDARTELLEFPELIKELPLFVNRNGYTSISKIYVEPKASGKSVVQVLRKESRLNVIEAKAPSADKITRANSVSPFIESGRVVLIDGSWNEAFLHQVTTFPRAAHDEFVDLLSQRISRIILTPERKYVSLAN